MTMSIAELQKNVIAMEVNGGERNGGIPAGTEDSLEYKLLLAYAERRRSSDKQLQQANGAAEGKSVTPAPSEDCGTPRKKRKNIKWKNLIPSCIRPQAKDSDDQGLQPAMLDFCDEQNGLDDVANKLTKIADSVHLSPGDLQSDGVEGEDVVQKIVELLREHGDKLNEKIENNSTLIQQLRGSFTYGFFERVASAFLQRLGPADIPNTEKPQEAKIALTFEVTRRLTSIDNHPMNRVMGFGAKYLQDHFSSWVTTQGGYEKVFSSEEEEEEEEEVH